MIDFSVILIEFSPFLRCTSACLFRWDLNYEEMLHGTGKLTVREKEYEGLEYFVKEWEKYQSQPSDHYDNYFIKDTIASKILQYLNPMNIYNKSLKTNKFKNRTIFVVSVLKKDFYWSKKYITYDGNNNKVLGKGMLENHIISIDKNGFGWIIPKEGKKCYGEIIEVAYEDFLDVEYYYGQGDSKMSEIVVKDGEKEFKVYAYILNELFDNVKSDVICEVEEYSLEMQKEKFNPMQHIINQQERYLDMSLDFNIKDSW